MRNKGKGKQIKNKTKLTEGMGGNKMEEKIK